MALSHYAWFDQDMFLTLDSNFMRSGVAIMLKNQNIKQAHMSEVWLCKGALNDEQ